MNDINVVIISGTVAESMKYPGEPIHMVATQSGKVGAEFTVRTVRQWKTGEAQAYVRVKYWGDGAQALRGTRFGASLMITGRLTVDAWQDKQGQKRSEMVVTAETVAGYMPPQAQAPQQQYPPQHGPQPQAYAMPQGGYGQPQPQSSTSGMEPGQDNLPF